MSVDGIPEAGEDEGEVSPVPLVLISFKSLIDRFDLRLDVEPIRLNDLPDLAEPTDRLELVLLPVGTLGSVNGVEPSNRPSDSSSSSMLGNWALNALYSDEVENERVGRVGEEDGEDPGDGGPNVDGETKACE